MSSQLLDMTDSFVPLYGLVTTIVLIVSLWLLQSIVRPSKGDIQSPATYAYGSVRKYPKPTVYQMLEEVFFMKYYKLVALQKNKWRSFDVVLSGEGLVQTFLIPGINRWPRVALSPLRAHGTVLDIEWMGDWRKVSKTVEVINAASFDYGGFGLLSSGASKVLEETLLDLPYMELEGSELISRTASHEASRFLGFSHGHFVTSGYSMNLIFFPAVHAAAVAAGKTTIFLMDGSSHNSMMIGTYISTGSKITRFEHNNTEDLERKLMAYKTDSNVEIIVGIEGNYSMEGGLPPLPALIDLKKKYGFKIYIDEAHSFLALGKTGRGIVEHYQDLGYAISADDVDCIGATMSKSVGTLGGLLACHDPKWSTAIVNRLVEVNGTGAGGELPTVIKMRLLQILRKPTLVRKRMNILRQHTVYIMESLHRAGLCVHSDYMSPVVVCIMVSLSGCARFGAECHRLGLAVTMAGPPATAPWRSVGRLCINALLSKEDVEQLVRIVVKAAVNIGNAPAKAYTIAKKLSYNFKEDKSVDGMIEEESSRVDEGLLELLRRQRLMNQDRSIFKHDRQVLQHGVGILHTQGLGATSNRLYWGSLLAHLQCEERLSTLYQSLRQCIPEVGTLIMTESRNTVSSTVATCIGPLEDKKALHLVLLPSGAGMGVREAIKSVKKSKKVQLCFYDSPEQITHLLNQATASKVHVTLYLQTFDERSTLQFDLQQVVRHLISAKIWQKKVRGIQILFDDVNGFGSMGPRRLGYLDQLEFLYGQSYLSETLGQLKKSTRLFIMGSFWHAFRLQGGFVITSKQMVKILHWTSRASMFATAPLPCNVGMAHEMIDRLVRKTSTIEEKAVEESTESERLEDVVDMLGISSVA